MDTLTRYPHTGRLADKTRENYDRRSAASVNQD